MIVIRDILLRLKLNFLNARGKSHDEAGLMMGEIWLCHQVQIKF